jgi:uncharacterized protein
MGRRFLFCAPRKAKKILAAAPTLTFRGILVWLSLLAGTALSSAQQKPVEPSKPGPGESIRNQALSELKKAGVGFDPHSFLEAVDRGDARLVRVFLAAGTDQNSAEQGTSVLMVASGLHPPNPKAGGCIGGVAYPCFTIAMRDSPGAVDIVRSLLANGASVNGRDGEGKTALHHAAGGANLEVAKVLLAYGADVQAADHHGTTPVNVVSLLNDDSSVNQLLLDHGGTINNPDGSSPGLLSAAAVGHVQTLRFLISRGANLNSRGSQGATALMEAASAGQVEIIDALLDHGVPVNQQDAQGFSALMYAAFNGRESSVDLLLRRGANQSLRNRSGETALAIAAKRKFPGVVKLLE